MTVDIRKNSVMLKIRIIGDQVLRDHANEVTAFDEKLKNLSEEMIAVMHASDGIGLAAPQVGISKRLLVTDISPVEKEYGPMVFVNPVVLESTGEVTLEEGCLSIPGIREDVSRPEEILLKYHSIDGEEMIEKFTGWMARVLQHEIDHLEGVLFIDHLTPLKQKVILNNFSS
jgi:peptide deformylase